MTKKFKTLKRFSLDFLGKDWKEAYVDFEMVSISDVQKVFPKFSMADTEKAEAVVESINDIVGFLEIKFISGKGVIEDGSLVDLTKEDLKELPAEFLSRALSFLSQGITPESPKL